MRQPAQTSVYDYLTGVREEKGAGFIVLIDPDKMVPGTETSFVERCIDAGVDAFFIGGTLLHATDLDALVGKLKTVTDRPLIGFPGSLSQLSGRLDALLYLSIVSGRNPEYLIGQHVFAAPLIRRLQLEAISTGYMLVESGRATTAQYMSHTTPLPRHKPEIAAATGLAAEMMGMKMLFADGGSGADEPIPEEMIAAIATTCSVPLIVGGGLVSANQIASRVQAGASFIVVGNALERNSDPAFIAELAVAAHAGVPRLT
jgi:phosphoglycerol geranylgeranyltransferase